uniref:Myosin motor domain-containing protein n=1 Tax=Anopheles dirus TaxID=7168 RepID=A0A182N298_9DIPT
MFNFMKKGVAGVAGGGGGGSAGSSSAGSGGSGGGGSGGSHTSVSSGGGGLSVIGALSGGADDRDDKDRRKKEKKLRKEGKQLLLGVGGASGGHSGSMSAEELLRLDEIRGRRKEKEKLPSGITADYSASFFAQLDVDHRELDRGTEEVLAVANTTTYIDRNGEMVERVSFSSTTTTLQPTSPSYGGGMDGPSREHNTSGGTKTNLPPIPPRPPKRGILKGSRTSLTGAGVGEVVASSPSSSTAAAMLQLLASPSPSADSLTDTTTTTTNSSFATPPFSLSPVGESQGYEGRIGRVHPFDERVTANGGVVLSLPPIHLQPLPPVRELVIQRQRGPRSDFGFSLRKAFVLDRPTGCRSVSAAPRSMGPPQMRAIIFAEPSSTGTVRTGLLPGDRLLRVNGQPVEELSRETIIELIRNSGDAVTVQVQPIAELIELSRRCVNVTPASSVPLVDDCNTLKRSASRRFQKLHATANGGEGAGAGGTGRTDLETSGSVGGRVWLIHRGGFTAAYKQQLSPSTVAMPSHHHQAGKVWIRLEASGEELLIDEDDLEVANPASLDLVEDLCQLPHLNESSVLHVLRQRYANNLIHTRAGPVLLIVNPMAPLALYSEKVASMFRGCKAEDDMPPHIFAQAQTAYRAMLETRRDQSLIFLGRSGAGKTTSFKHALYYLTLASRQEQTQSTVRALTVEKVSAIGTIMDAFGNERTSLNGNATKFTQIFALDFDHSGQIVSGSIQIMPIDRMRPAGGGAHRVGSGGTPRWSFLAGVDGGALRKELLLEPVAADAGADGGNATLEQESIDYQRLCQAFRVLNIEQGAVRGVWYVLAAIHHLSQSGAVTVAGRVQFVNPRAAQKAAMLLGIPMEDLLSYVFPDGGAGAGGGGGGGGSGVGTSKANLSTGAVVEGLNAFIEALYTELFYTIVGLINKSIAAVTPHQTIGSVLLVDVPGFQNPASVGGGSSGASTLADLRFNYLHERLQLLFHNAMLVQPRARYAQEMVTVEDSLALMTPDSAGNSGGAGGGGGGSGGHSSPAAMVALLDKVPQSHEPRKGLLWMLDEEQLLNPRNPSSRTTDGTDDFDDDGAGDRSGADDRDARFLERLFAAYGDRESRETLLLRASVPTGACDVVLQHLLGTNPVLYSVTSWLKEAAAQAHYMPQRALNCLRDSVKPEIGGLFVGTLGGAMDSFAFGGGGSSQQLQQQSLRRMSSIRRTYTGTGFPKRNSVIVQVKYTVDCLIDTLRRTGMHFVYCYLPQHNGGTAMASGCAALEQQPLYELSIANGAGRQREEVDIINIPLLRSQLRGSQMLDFARLYRLGFPISVPLAEFVIRFGLLAEGGTAGGSGGGSVGGSTNSEAATVDNILSNCEVDSSVYRIGTSQSDWSEDSGRMSNENLELFGGDPDPPKPSPVTPPTGGSALPGKLDESLLGIFENSAVDGGTVIVPTPVVHSGAPYAAAAGRWNRPVLVGGGAGTLPMRKKSTKGQVEQPTITINGDTTPAVVDGGEKVFFRSGVLGALEAKRDDLLSDRVIQLQAHCRGYLARRRLARRRLQELAVKCIQRNVRAFLKVRDWPWWRLLVRVTPLLAVHRTEEQLKAATVELQQVRAKLEKIEAERNELKATNHKLEAR